MKPGGLKLRLVAFAVGATCAVVALIDIGGRNNMGVGYSILPVSLSGTFPSFTSAFAGTLLALAIVGPAMLNQYLLICGLVVLGGSARGRSGRGS